LLKDKDELLTFFGFPAEHWTHLRTTNPIESTFSTVKVRTKRTKGAGSRKAGLAMAFKLLLEPNDAGARSMLRTWWLWFKLESAFSTESSWPRRQHSRFVDGVSSRDVRYAS